MLESKSPDFGFTKVMRLWTPFLDKINRPSLLRWAIGSLSEITFQPAKLRPTIRELSSLSLLLLLAKRSPYSMVTAL
jgi:hypothetical protein